MGGNAAGHHPLAAGEQILKPPKTPSIWLILIPPPTSLKRRLRNNSLRRLHEPLRRNKTTHASPRLHLPHHRRLRPARLPQRRHPRLLRLLPHNPYHDRPLHCPPIHRLRVPHEIPPATTITRLRPTHALHSGRFGGGFRSSCHDAAGRHQDFAADEGRVVGFGDQACEGFGARGGDHLEEAGDGRVL